MKAKEYVEKFFANLQENEDKLIKDAADAGKTEVTLEEVRAFLLKTVADLVVDLVNETEDQIKKTGAGFGSLQNVLRFYKEAFAKWKSVVAAINDRDAAIPISVQQFPTLLLKFNPQLYHSLVQHQVLIGYEKSKVELEALQ